MRGGEAGGVTRRAGRLRACVALLTLFLASAPAAAEPDAYPETLARARALLQEGEPEAADRAFSRAAEQARAEPVRDEAVRREIRALAGRLSALGMLSDLIGMRDVSRRLLELRILAGDDARTAGTRANLGYFEAELGNREVAFGLLEAARTHAVASKDAALLATSLVRLAQLRFLERRHVEALGYAEDALAVAQEASLARDIADARGLLGVVHLDLGDLERAVAEYEQVLAWAAENDPFLAADARSHIAIARRLQGDLRTALQAFAETAETYRAAGDLRRVARVHIQVAEIYVEHERFDAAVESLEAARALLRGDPLTDAHARVQLGLALLGAGRVDAARPHLDAALAAGRDLGDRHLEARAHVGLATAALVGETVAVALAHVQRALTLVDDMVAGLAPTEAAAGRGERAFVYRAAVDVGYASGKPEVLLDTIERSRAATLLRGPPSNALVAGVPGRADLAAAEREARLRLLETRAHYAAATEGGRLAAIREAAKARDAARLAYEGIVARMQRRAPGEPGGPQASRATLAELQSALAEEEVFVAYALGSRDAYALTVTRDRSRPVSLGPHAPITAALLAFCVPDLTGEEIDRALDGPGERGEGTVPGLREALVAPLGLESAARCVLVSPDGALARLPFALLLSSREIALVPSATVHLRLGHQAALRGDGVLACGDPRYTVQRDGHAVAVYAGRSRLARLPATRAEVELVTREGDVCLVDHGATETAFRKRVSERARWHGVHLACHGIVHDERPWLSALALTPDGTHDGFLTALEVFGMSIPADLVVLSACDTGLGRTFAGDGLLGLSQAFLHAGTPRVLCGLWKVDDLATQALMVHFYRLWREDGLEVADALAQAQAAVRTEPRWRHPRYWAGWTLWGLPR